jgi:hypothetical protein
MRVLSTIKSWVVSPGATPRTIKSGAMKGLKMQLDLTYETQLMLGLQEREIQGWLERISDRLEVGIDIGAAAGEFTLFFLAKSSANNVLSFEPQEQLRARISGNLALNGVEKDGRLTLCPDFVGADLRPRMVTLDSFVPRMAGPVLVKVDVDGGEMDVLRGADALIKRPQVRWIIETHTPKLERDCLAILQAAGYQTRVVPNAWSCPRCGSGITAGSWPRAKTICRSK